jgi:aflatoxin B1 aldehyde reductase
MPKLYCGTMTFGWKQSSSYIDEPTAKKMTKKFIDFGIKTTSAETTTSSTNSNVHYIDTARIYAGGKTEKILGPVLQDVSSYCDLDSIVIGTKAHPSQPNGLSKIGIMDQFKASTEAMGVNKVGEYYLHQPDTEHSLLESLQCVHQLIIDGKVKSLGLSNYHVSEVSRAFQLCEEYNLTKPTIYQGLYNPLNRAVEKELIPLLKANECSFVAYNPLAAGLLTGKHKRVEDDGDVIKGRFKKNQNYLPRFYTSDNFDALDLITSVCEEEGLTLIEATFKWLLRHSVLEEQDGVLLGASSTKQLDQNLKACLSAVDHEHPLSEKVLKAFDDAWQITEKSAFPYWRSYSSDMPNRESLDHGASYSATKK